MAFISNSAHYVRRSTRSVGQFSIGDQVTVVQDVTHEKHYAVDKSLYDFVMSSLKADASAYEERTVAQVTRHSDVPEAFLVGMIVGSDSDTYSILLCRGNMISRVPQFYKGASVIELLPRDLWVATTTVDEFDYSVSVRTTHTPILEAYFDDSAIVKPAAVAVVDPTKEVFSALTAAIASMTALNNSLIKRLDDNTVAINEMKAELKEIRASVYRIPKKRKYMEST